MSGLLHSLSYRVDRTRTIGIALLEVLLSVSIIGIGMGALLRTISVGTRTQSHVEARALALRLAETKLLELRLSGHGSQRQEVEGQFESPYDGYGWSARIQPSGGEEPFTLVRLSIWSRETGQRRTLITVQTLFSES